MKKTKPCFECKKEATENHHVIPKSLGGTKTVPLCTICHMKVHSLEKTKRADSSPELTKRGLDKNRAWDLFAVYQALTLYEAETISDVIDVLHTNFKIKDYTPNKVERLMSRLDEMDKVYLNNFFDDNVGKDLSYVWNGDRAELYSSITIDTINNILEERQYQIPKITSELMCEIKTKIDQNFLYKIKNV